MRQWRLLRDEPLSGAQNMARDEAILDAVSVGQQPPTLRLYAWQPWCLSLGYSQNYADVDGEALSARGWQVVRRPTGGRAILHAHELTYSLALPIDHPLALGDVVESYRLISRGLMKALECLGLQPYSDKNPNMPSNLSAVCFQVPSHYEITVQGRKLIGSAQLRRKEGILQHGTLPLSGDLGDICQALRYDDEAERQAAALLVRQHALTLQEALGRVLEWDEVAEAFAEGFSRAFDLELIPAALSPAEEARASALQAQVYATSDWLHKR
ncbi:MAG: lipoate--protein ligase family protein [Anaerolineae bacterium]|nr:lipoate--protein ligase family protein [Anaerolineae bacterium]MDW8173048.1 lipoate--protein ligase family protein [Anaerolineae bacterium]